MGAEFLVAMLFGVLWGGIWLLKLRRRLPWGSFRYCVYLVVTVEITFIIVAIAFSDPVFAVIGLPIAAFAVFTARTRSAAAGRQ
jgi:hypothetical protein